MHPALGAAGWEAQRFWLKAFIRCAIASCGADSPFKTAARADMSFEQRTSAIFDIDFARFAFSDLGRKNP